ncbi:MAG: arginase family protein [Bacilli bacterium]|nr:arginase family protein [Bacilli bacterium]
MITKIFNANTDLGVNKKGTALGPKIISEKMNLEVVNIDYTLLPEKDIKNKININSINHLNEKIYNEILKTKDFSILLGGDHSTSIASALASIKKEEKLGIIWIDAHGDYNDFNTTITGNIHGVPLATVCGSNGEELSYFHNGNYYNPKNAVIFGARDLDEKEKEKLEKDNVNVFYYDDIKNNIENSLKDAFKLALDGNDKIHISFDLDSINPILAPGVTVPVKDGFNLEDVEIIINFIKDNISKVNSFDLVEYNPLFDKDEKTLEIATDILKKIIE